jgi:CopG-like RHH_1 or ribbon-helix-helix domain, RHH_5
MCKRTTIRLPEDLLNRARRKAVAEGQTLSSLIEDGLGVILSKKPRSAKRKRTIALD